MEIQRTPGSDIATASVSPSSSPKVDMPSAKNDDESRARSAEVAASSKGGQVDQYA
jgi:hypothetical protein